MSGGARRLLTRRRGAGPSSATTVRREAASPVAVLEHRDVASRALGRPLSSDEIVHHIDLDTTNNDPSNLDVLRDMSAHLRAHRSLDRLVAPLLAGGVTHYDRDLGAYVFGAQL